MPVIKKDRTVNTKQGKLTIWEHDSETIVSSPEQRYASKIYNDVKGTYTFKLHSSLNALESYINVLNIV